MFADSYYVILLGLLVGIPTLIFLLWALVAGHFDQLDANAFLIFDEEDLNAIRPWETHTQRRERIRHYGSPLNAQPEWFKWL
jgi:cbb3-type cytochrome oxidase maturation protein